MKKISLSLLVFSLFILNGCFLIKVEPSYTKITPDSEFYEKKYSNKDTTTIKHLTAFKPKSHISSYITKDGDKKNLSLRFTYFDREPMKFDKVVLKGKVNSMNFRDFDFEEKKIDGDDIIYGRVYNLSSNQVDLLESILVNNNMPELIFQGDNVRQVALMKFMTIPVLETIELLKKNNIH